MLAINTVAELAEVLASGPYAWPGGYPLYFVMGDGAAVSFNAVKENLPEIMPAMTSDDPHDKEWRVIACEINWEDPDLYCAHTNERIESAYAEPETDSD